VQEQKPVKQRLSGARRMQITAGKGVRKSSKSANDKGERVGRGWIGLCSYKNGKSPAQMLIM
jgi:hypothetical protein